MKHLLRVNALAFALCPPAWAGTITLDAGVAGLESIPVEDFRIGAERQLSSGGSGGSSTTLARDALIVTRVPDALSPVLAQRFHAGTGFTTVVLTTVGDDGQQTTVTLGTLTIDALTSAEAPDGRAREQLSFTWQTISLAVTP